MNGLPLTIFLSVCEMKVKLARSKLDEWLKKEFSATIFPMYDHNYYSKWLRKDCLREI